MAKHGPDKTAELAGVIVAASELLWKLDAPALEIYSWLPVQVHFLVLPDESGLPVELPSHHEDRNTPEIRMRAKRLPGKRLLRSQSAQKVPS